MRTSSCSCASYVHQYTAVGIRLDDVVLYWIVLATLLLLKTLTGTIAFTKPHPPHYKCACLHTLKTAKRGNQQRHLAAVVTTANARVEVSGGGPEEEEEEHPPVEEGVDEHGRGKVAGAAVGQPRHHPQPKQLHRVAAALLVHQRKRHRAQPHRRRRRQPFGEGGEQE
eukprot:CAMPEP_0118947006 /NCGR_PEP_ID=MMETSP1169-20130426/45227_1 /TAXON_ID=36882 /ORGANISM="Pyramimonas obovata, Strain CCMP722" /LENGTH=167 /DNA_ID=CAMNT_0006893129 /DNA_START=96 /DNA_END=597 /DNA_ORIENTATION=-